MLRIRQVLIAMLLGFPLLLSASPTGESLQKATNINALGSRLLEAKLVREGVGNAMVSSVSLFYALSMLHAGAAAHTHDLLHKILLANAESKVSDIAPTLAHSLVSASPYETNGNGMFELSNSIWSTNGESNNQPFYFSKAFQALVAENYGASVHRLDFLASGASRVVNSWAEEKTNGLIPTIIDDKTVSTFQWLLINAAYFEGRWAIPMREIPAKGEQWFTLISGEQVSAPSIKSDDFRSTVRDLPNGDVAFLVPFAGQKYSLAVYLPAREIEDISRWLIEYGAQNLPDVVGKLLDNSTPIVELVVRIPSFEFGDSVEMKKGSEIADDLGLSPLFRESADYSSLVDYDKTPASNSKTTVGLIKQDTRIELDKNGVKAAAVTLVGGIKVTSVGVPRQPRMITVDRPFAFGIVENSSQTLLFNGILATPD